MITIKTLTKAFMEELTEEFSDLTGRNVCDIITDTADKHLPENIEDIISILTEDERIAREGADL